jgi:2-O-A-mannosyl-D-glycerate-specific PTS system IIC component
MAAAGWFGAALIGTIISTAILLLWRRQAVKQGKYVTDSVMP